VVRHHDRRDQLGGRPASVAGCGLGGVVVSDLGAETGAFE
jgi:hypothetical protein